MEVKVYRKIVTIKSRLNKLLRIPQRVSVNRIGVRVPLFGGKKELNKNIVTIIHTYKNKQIVTVKTDIDSRYLRPI